MSRRGGKTKRSRRRGATRADPPFEPQHRERFASAAPGSAEASRQRRDASAEATRLTRRRILRARDEILRRRASSSSYVARVSPSSPFAVSDASDASGPSASRDAARMRAAPSAMARSNLCAASSSRPWCEYIRPRRFRISPGSASKRANDARSSSGSSVPKRTRAASDGTAGRRRRRVQRGVQQRPACVRVVHAQARRGDGRGGRRASATRKAPGGRTVLVDCCGGTQRLSRGAFKRRARAGKQPRPGASPIRRAPPQRYERRLLAAQAPARPRARGRERVAATPPSLRQGPRVALCRRRRAPAVLKRRDNSAFGAKLGDAQASTGGGDGRATPKRTCLRIVLVVMRCDAAAPGGCFCRVRLSRTRPRRRDDARFPGRAEPGGSIIDARSACRRGAVFARDARTLLDERARLLRRRSARESAPAATSTSRPCRRARRRAWPRSHRAPARRMGARRAREHRRRRRGRTGPTAAAPKVCRKRRRRAKSQNASTARIPPPRTTPRARRGKRPRAVEALGERVRRAATTRRSRRSGSSTGRWILDKSGSSPVGGPEPEAVKAAVGRAARGGFRGDRLRRARLRVVLPEKRREHRHERVRGVARVLRVRARVEGVASARRRAPRRLASARRTKRFVAARVRRGNRGGLSSPPPPRTTNPAPQF